MYQNNLTLTICCVIFLVTCEPNFKFLFMDGNLAFMLELLSAKAKAQEPEVSIAADAFTHFKHLLLPITDSNPYLSEGSRQVIFL